VNEFFGCHSGASYDYSLLGCDAMQYGRGFKKHAFIFNPDDGGSKYHSNHWYLSTRLHCIIPTKTAILRKNTHFLQYNATYRLQEATAIKMNCNS